LERSCLDGVNKDITIDFSLVDISTKIGGCRQSVFSKGNGLTTVIVWVDI